MRTPEFEEITTKTLGVSYPQHFLGGGVMFYHHPKINTVLVQHKANGKRKPFFASHLSIQRETKNKKYYLNIGIQATFFFLCHKTNPL